MGLLKTDLVRAIVRLPAGLATAHGRQRLAMWCLGPSPDTDSPGHGLGPRTLVADLANEKLDSKTIEALVADIVASVSGRLGLAAHALLLCRSVPTSELQLSDDDLVAPISALSMSEPVAEIVDRWRTVSDSLRSAVPSFVPPTFAVRHGVSRPALTTMAAALANRHIQVLPGLRLEEGDTSASGIPVVGPAEVIDAGRDRQLRIDPLVLAARYPTSRLTEAGDIVFCTAPQPAAWVDREGGSVVSFPARVLRCADRRLVPAVVAVDINNQPKSAKAWRAWSLRYVPSDQAAGLAALTAEIARHRGYLHGRIDALDQLAETLITGASGGALDLNEHDSSNLEGH